MDIYREIILEHYKYPKNFGHLKKSDIVLEVANVSCGDRIGMEINFDKKAKTIADIRFFGEGCAISIASSSLLTDKVKGLSTEKVMQITSRDIQDLLDTTLTPTRLKCAILPLEVLQTLVKNWSQKR